MSNLERQPFTPETRTIEMVEKDAWRKKVFGIDVEVTPVPSIVTQEVKQNLERLRFGLYSIPKLDIGTIYDLNNSGVEKYLEELQRRYPNWRRYESLIDTEKEDHSVSRNLEEWYWHQVKIPPLGDDWFHSGGIKEGDIEFPQFPGYWIAVENFQKPPFGDLYPKTKTSEILSLEDRFHMSWVEVDECIDVHKEKLLVQAGLPTSLTIRMPEVQEWNLLANREGWGTTDTSEWMNTEYYYVVDDLIGPFVKQNHLIAGFSFSGGAACVDHRSSNYSSGRIGFRLAIILGS